MIFFFYLFILFMINNINIICSFVVCLIIKNKLK